MGCIGYESVEWVVEPVGFWFVPFMLVGLRFSADCAWLWTALCPVDCVGQWTALFCASFCGVVEARASTAVYMDLEGIDVSEYELPIQDYHCLMKSCFTGQWVESG